LDNPLDPAQILAEIEKSIGKKFAHSKEITAILLAAQQHRLKEPLDQLLFYSKFLVNAQTVLNRSGIAADETEKLSNEFRASLEKVKNNLTSIFSRGEEAERRAFGEAFMDLTPVSLQNLLSLVRELSWLKNFELDSNRPLW
jgi:hypothetical protein